MKKAILFIAAILAVNFTWAQWEPDVRLTNDPAKSWTPSNSCKPIVVSGDSVHLVWQDFRTGNAEIFYKSSTNGGLNWCADTQLTNALRSSYDPSIGLMENAIHVFWTDSRDGSDIGEIYYKRSEDRGATWGEDTRLTYSGSWAESPSIAVDGSVIHLVWYDLRDATSDWDYDIYYKRSIDGGLNWEPEVRLTNNPSYSGFPCVSVSGQVVIVVWEDDRDGTSGEGSGYYKRSADGGITWSADMRLTDATANAWDPAVAISGSDVHVVWHDDRDGGGREIYYKHSTDGGVTWEPDTRLTNAIAESEYPTVEASGTKVHVSWGDKRDMNYEIYYKRSEDNGITWEDDVRLTNSFQKSDYSFVTVSDYAVHVIWNESRDGNEEIYYKRNPTGNLFTGSEEFPVSNNDPLLTIYPNPASTVVHIHVDDNSGQKTLLTIRGNLGETVLRKQIKKESILDVSSLPGGLYFIEVVLPGNQIVKQKLVIVK